MDILEQVKAMLNREEAEQDQTYRQMLRSLFSQHDACVARQDWHGAYLALLEILSAVTRQRQRQGTS